MELDLRLILLTVGLLVIAAIILDGIRRKRKIQKQVEYFEDKVIASVKEAYDDVMTPDDIFLEKEIDPLLEDKSIMSSTIESNVPKKRPIKSNNSQDVIAITVLPAHNVTFSGKTLYAFLQTHNIKYGERRIFHKYRQDKIDNEILYSIASITEPGSFEVNKLASMQFNGLVFFMVSANLQDADEIFEMMLAMARMMAAHLQGKVCDNNRNPLTKSSIEHYKSMIQKHQNNLELEYA